MPATTQPTTFDDLRTDLLNRARDLTTSGSAAVTQAGRYINQANHDLHIQQNWPWAERQAVLLTHATYTTGRLSIASTARTTLEGSSGTLWNTTVSGMGFTNMRARGKLVVGGETDVYIVSSVTSDVAAVLDSRYVGNIAAATAYALAYGSYTYFEDEYALAADFWRLIDARQFSDAIDLPVEGKQDFFRHYPRNSSPGRPRVCTLVELGPASSVALRPRVILHPPPDAVYQIPYRYITSSLAVSTAGVGAANLSATDDEPIIPLRYRHVLVLYALAQWYRDKKDDPRTAAAQAEYVDLVKRMANDSDPQRDRPRFRTNRAVYARQLAWPRRGSRYSADSRFDELRD